MQLYLLDVSVCWIKIRLRRSINIVLRFLIENNTFTSISYFVSIGIMYSRTEIKQYLPNKYF